MQYLAEVCLLAAALLASEAAGREAGMVRGSTWYNAPALTSIPRALKMLKSGKQASICHCSQIASTLIGCAKFELLPVSTADWIDATNNVHIGHMFDCEVCGGPVACLNAGLQCSVAHVGLDPQGTAACIESGVRGAVFDDPDGDGVVDAASQNLNETFTVRLFAAQPATNFDCRSSTPLHTAQTESITGQFDFGFVAPGIYYLAVDVPADYRQTSALADGPCYKVVDVTAGGVVQALVGIQKLHE